MTRAERAAAIVTLFNETLMTGNLYAEFSADDIMKSVFTMKTGDERAPPAYSTVLRDLNALAQAGILAKERRGTRNFYRLAASSEILSAFEFSNTGRAFTDNMVFTLEIDGVRHPVTVAKQGDSVTDAVTAYISDLGLAPEMEAKIIEALGEGRYEIAFSINADGTLKKDAFVETAMVFRADGSYVYRSRNKVDAGTQWILHSHPTMSEAFEADMENRQVLDGAGSMVILPDGSVRVLFAPTARAAMRTGILTTTDEVVGETARLSYTFEATKPEAEAAAPIPTGMGEMIEKKLPAAVGIGDLMPVSAVISALVAKRAPPRLVQEVTEIASDKNLSSLQIADAIARVLKQAGVYDGNLAVVVDCRSGAYDFGEVEAAMRNVATTDSPVRYFIIAEEGRTSANPDVNVVNVPAGAEAGMMTAVRKAIDGVAGKYNVKIDNWNVAYAFPEAEMGVVADHYRSAMDMTDIKTMSNFLVTGKKAFKTAAEHAGVPGATIMMELAARLASQDRPTALTVQCSRQTVGTLQSLLGGILRVIQRMNIGEIFTDFMRAMKEAARSL